MLKKIICKLKGYHEIEKGKCIVCSKDAFKNGEIVSLSFKVKCYDE